MINLDLYKLVEHSSYQAARKNIDDAISSSVIAVVSNMARETSTGVVHRVSIDGIMDTIDQFFWREKSLLNQLVT